MVLHAVARKFRKAVFFAAHRNARVYAFSVAGQNVVFFYIERFGFRIVLAVLQAVVTYNVYGEPAELIKNTVASARARHKELVFFRKSHKRFVVCRFKGGFVLCKCAVKVKCNQFYHF